MTLEVLISTMNRKDLSFLDSMFAKTGYHKYQILIVNQTSKDKILESNQSNIRIVNSFEYGLSKSRNLAIKRAFGDICLLADDDITYVKDFDKIVLETFENFNKADIITFQMVDESGKLFNDYPNIIEHDKKTLKTVNSVVIAFNRKAVNKQQIRFNEHFGLGAKFQTADEYIFLRNALASKLTICFQNKVILSHKFYSSGKAVGSDRKVYAMGALFYKYSNILAYLRLIKHLFFIYKRKYISLRELLPKFLIGIKGIRDYKRLQ